MKLWYSPTSPFTRKVLILAHEKGLAADIELLPVNPWEADSAVPQDNPLGKIPALVTNDGERLSDSPFICEDLDAQFPGRRLFPSDGPARWTALRRQVIADGLLDAAMLARVETTSRPEELRWSWWLERQNTIVARALDALEQEAAALDGFATIGEITIFCALSYLDLRFPANDWRHGRSRLTEWRDKVDVLDSARLTAIPGSKD